MAGPSLRITGRPLLGSAIPPPASAPDFCAIASVSLTPDIRNVICANFAVPKRHPGESFSSYFTGKFIIMMPSACHVRQLGSTFSTLAQTLVNMAEGPKLSGE